MVPEVRAPFIEADWDLDTMEPLKPLPRRPILLAAARIASALLQLCLSGKKLLPESVLVVCR